MESPINQEQMQATPSTRPVVYSAVGWVAGTYQPGEKKFEWGTLVTEDGQIIRANLDWSVRHQLKKQQRALGTESNCLETTYRWKVYPRTYPLRFDIQQVKPLHCTSKKGKHKQRPLDEFRIVGKIKAIADGKVIVRVRRNELPPPGKEGSWQYRPITLAFTGSLPAEALGEIWELKVRRQGEHLVVAKGKAYQPSQEDLAWLKQKAKKDRANGLLCDQTQTSDTKAIATSQVPLLEASVSVTQEEATTVVVQQQQTLQTVEIASNPIAVEMASVSQIASPVDELAQPVVQQKKVSTSSKKLQTQESSPTASSERQKQQQSGKKRSQSTSKQTVAPAKKPVFQVKVNGQSYYGYESVMLNKRMLHIDGKPVASAKLAVVLGSPKTMQADGKVTQADNQALLVGR